MIYIIPFLILIFPIYLLNFKLILYEFNIFIAHLRFKKINFYNILVSVKLKFLRMCTYYDTYYCFF
jgi:hypothetical protein